jgi:hypothetical protein
MQHAEGVDMAATDEAGRGSPRKPDGLVDPPVLSRAQPAIRGCPDRGRHQILELELRRRRGRLAVDGDDARERGLLVEVHEVRLGRRAAARHLDPQRAAVVVHGHDGVGGEQVERVPLGPHGLAREGGRGRRRDVDGVAVHGALTGGEHQPNRTRAARAEGYGQPQGDRQRPGSAHSAQATVGTSGGR